MTASQRQSQPMSEPADGIDVPQGYKRTDAGLIPTDWLVKLLPEVCRFRGGKAHEPFISDAGRFICVNSKFISTDGRTVKHSTVNLCPARKNDVLMVMSDLPNGRALAKAFLVDRDDFYAVNQRVCALTPYRAWPAYLYYVLNRNAYFLKFDDGVNQTHLLNRVFQNCPIPLPPTSYEQQAIAQALSDVDGLLGALDALIVKKRAIKLTVVQQLLTGRTRLPGFSGAWEIKQLRGIADLHRGNVVPAHDAQVSFTHFSLPAFDDGRAAVVEPGHRIGSNKFHVPPTAVLVSKLNPRIPRVWAPRDIGNNAVASTEFLVLTPREGVSREFLFVVCSSPRFCEQMESSATGTTGSHQRISPQRAMQIEIGVPPSVKSQ